MLGPQAGSGRDAGLETLVSSMERFLPESLRISPSFQGDTQFLVIPACLEAPLVGAEGPRLSLEASPLLGACLWQASLAGVVSPGSPLLIACNIFSVRVTNSDSGSTMTLLGPLSPRQTEAKSGLWGQSGEARLGLSGAPTCTSSSTTPAGSFQNPFFCLTPSGLHDPVR